MSNAQAKWPLLWSLGGQDALAYDNFEENELGDIQWLHPRRLDREEVLELLRTHPVDYCILTWKADNPEEGIHEQLWSHANAGGSLNAVQQLTQDKVTK